ncbi:MAG: carbon-nitrogen family hydrolase [Candidatus Sumerlaeota bacterium]|nr:carbon-nitrogen family hydrolase [Candidatus Sumerlaeota bacterium]
MKIACVQMDIAWEAPEANLAKARSLVAQAAQSGAELVCLPELFSTGVTLNASRFAESANGATPRALSEIAASNGVMLIGTYITAGSAGVPARKMAPRIITCQAGGDASVRKEMADCVFYETGENAAVCKEAADRIANHAGEDACAPRAFNTSGVWGAEGRLMGVYHKNHVFTYGGEHIAYSSGDEAPIFRVGKFAMGLFICYDLRFPEMFRAAVACGADLFVIPANWPNPRKDHWLTLLKARAIENQAYVIGVNRTGASPSHSYFGASLVVSPRGEVLAQAGEGEELLLADIHPEEVTSWRNEFPALKDRKDTA